MSNDPVTPVRPSRRCVARGRRTAKQWIGLTLVVLGLVIFVASNLGARAGFTVLPFDPHHVLGQLVIGPASAVLGAILLGHGR